MRVYDNVLGSGGLIELGPSSGLGGSASTTYIIESPLSQQLSKPESMSRDQVLDLVGSLYRVCLQGITSHFAVVCC